MKLKASVWKGKLLFSGFKQTLKTKHWLKINFLNQISLSWFCVPEYIISLFVWEVRTTSIF